MIKLRTVGVSFLREYVTYNPLTGIFVYNFDRGRHNCHKSGKIAGAKNSSGYIELHICASRILAHRAAWAYMTGNWPKDRIDHKNRKRDDNRWINLRESTDQTNMFNVSLQKNNSSGVTGISWMRSKNKWRVQLGLNYKSVHIGLFEDFDEAKEALIAAKDKLHVWPETA